MKHIYSLKVSPHPDETAIANASGLEGVVFEKEWVKLDSESWMDVRHRETGDDLGNSREDIPPRWWDIYHAPKRVVTYEETDGDIKEVVWDGILAQWERMINRAGIKAARNDVGIESYNASGDLVGITYVGRSYDKEEREKVGAKASEIVLVVDSLIA